MSIYRFTILGFNYFPFYPSVLDFVLVPVLSMVMILALALVLCLYLDMFGYK